MTPDSLPETTAGPTQGPWHAKIENVCPDGPPTFVGYVMADDDGRSIEIAVLYGAVDDDQRNANARLIAAAPTMYQELELAADTFRDVSSVLRAIGKDMMAAAADIAARHIREQLAAISERTL